MLSLHLKTIVSYQSRGIMENEMEKKMEDDMESGAILGHMRTVANIMALDS